MKEKYYVYILTDKSNRVLCTGITNNLVKRVYQHKNKFVSSFTSRHNVNKLVYFEILKDVENATKREKQIKAGSRKKKVNLILQTNPKYEDLYLKIF